MPLCSKRPFVVPSCSGQNRSLQPWCFWDSPANWGRQFEAAAPALDSAQGLIFSTIAHLLNASSLSPV